MINYRPHMKLDGQRQELLENSSRHFDLTMLDSTREPGIVPGRVISPHWHRQLEVFFLPKGRVQVGVGDKTWLLGAGESCLINSGALHSFTYLEGPAQYRSFLFNPGIVAGAPGSVFDTDYVRPFVENGPSFIPFTPAGDAAFFEAFRETFRLCREEPPGYELAVRWALSQILFLAKQKGGVRPSRKVTHEQEARVKAMLRWMEEHLSKPITVYDIARYGNICVRTCQKAFRRYLHCSPTEYLQRRRISAAAQRLTFTDEPITTIALDCGFSSPSYFTKCFRAEMGCSPKEYRAAARAGADGQHEDGE